VDAQSCTDPRCYRVWIARYDRWEPTGPGDVPPGAVALEPAEEGTMTDLEARAYAEAFNRIAAHGQRKIWAVALPVVIRYEGEPQPGQPLDGLPGGRRDIARANGAGPAELGA